MRKNSIIFLVGLIGMLVSHFASAVLVDPTRPVSYIQQGLSSTSLQLSAILYSSNRKVVVINDQVMEEGQDILGNHLVDIKINSVQLEGPGGKINLILLKPFFLPQKGKI